MRDIRQLRQFWQAHDGDELMLCTIVRKRGSGYRATGAKKLVTRDGQSLGYLSGGCLDGDIVSQALTRWDEAPFVASFSTMSDEDRLMGYQTGCAGILDILFERLPRDAGQVDDYLPFGSAPAFTGVAISLVSETLGQRCKLDTLQQSDDTMFVDEWVRPVTLHVLGAGANAQPFADLAGPLGWDVDFVDYRAGNVVPNAPSRIVPVDTIAAGVREGPRVAVVLATHNYEADLTIMSGLLGRNFGYLGCVGPRRRFDQMRQDLKTLHKVEMDDAWAAKVHAPAGLWQARSPEDIAFSIIADIQQSFAA